MSYPQDAPARTGVRQHAMMPVPEHDDVARRSFVVSYMEHVNQTIEDGNHTIWDKRVSRAFRAENGREPKRIGEVRRAMLREPYTQYWSSLRRCGKEMQYESVGPMVERQLPDLITKAKKYRDSNKKLGSLMLDPSIKAPRYNTEIEIHAKPGGYHTDLTEDDVFAGAEFDWTLDMVGMGTYGEWCDDMGASLAAWTRKNLAQLEPSAILDMGCTIGHSTLPWVDYYPEAEIHAIDVAAPCLRYAHARAEALGMKVQFSQDNAEHTRFEPGSFELIVSHILLHELSYKAIHNIYMECFRLLKPGGYMLHMDLPPKRDMDTVTHFLTDWNTHFQAEPFITTLTELDLHKVATKAGFDMQETFEDYAPTLVPDFDGKRHLFGARK
jgi:ubiquinone/menaquinone biosynthesis C-methylase UbiE